MALIKAFAVAIHSLFESVAKSSRLSLRRCRRAATLLFAKLSTVFYKGLSSRCSFLRQLVLDTPVHGPLPIAAASNNKQLRIASAFLLFTFVCITISDMQDAVAFYAKESGYVETRIVRQEYFNFSFGYLALSWQFDADWEIDTARKIFPPGMSPSEYALWNHTDETRLPPTDDRLWMVLKYLADLRKSDMSLAFHTLDLADGLANGKEELSAESTHFRLTPSAPMFKVFKKQGVDFWLLHNTAAVLLCLVTSPKILYSGGSIDASTICRKENVHVSYITPPGAFWYRIPSGALGKLRKPVRRLELTVQGRSDRAIIQFALILSRRSVTNVMSYDITGVAWNKRWYDKAAPSCYQAVVAQRTPIAYTFERRNGPPCRTTRPDELPQECPYRCVGKHVRRICGCHLLAGAVRAPADDQWMCLQQAERNRSKFAPFINGCWRTIIRSDSSELKRCFTACSEGHCEHVLPSNAETLLEPCRDAIAKRGPNTTVARFDERTFARSFDYTFTETPTTNATTILCLFGGILGNWIGSTPTALLHIAISFVVFAVSVIWRSISSAKTIDQNVDANEEPPETRVSNNLYFHFLNDALDLRGLSRLCCLTGIALCFGMQVLDTVGILRAFVNEITTTDITFTDEAADLVNPTLCFNFFYGAPNTAEVPHGPCSSLKAQRPTPAHHHCLLALMSLEQSIFFPGNKTHEMGAFSGCSELFRCSNATVWSMLNAMSMGFCSAWKLVWVLRLPEKTPRTAMSLCEEENMRWLGPYFPFHQNSVVCFTIPINETRNHVRLLINADPFGGKDPERTLSMPAFFSNDGQWSILRNSAKDWSSPTNYVVLRTSGVTMSMVKLSKPIVYRRENLTRRRCFDANAKFDCERRCYNELIVKRCGYESVSYGDTRSLQEAHQLFENSITTCLLKLTNANFSSERDHCLDACRNMEQCEIVYTQLVPLKQEENFKTKGLSAHIIIQREPRAVVAEARIYSDLDQIFAAIGGSLGLWLGGSMFALCQLVLLTFQFACRRVSQLWNSKSEEEREAPRHTESAVCLESSVENSAVAAESGSSNGEAEEKAVGVTEQGNLCERENALPPPLDGERTDASSNGEAKEEAVGVTEQGNLCEREKIFSPALEGERTDASGVDRSVYDNEETSTESASCLFRLWTPRLIAWHLHYAYVACAGASVTANNAIAASPEDTQCFRRRAAPLRASSESNDVTNTNDEAEVTIEEF